MAEQEERNPRPLFLIAGMINTKDQTGYFRAFHGMVRHVYTVPVSIERRRRAERRTGMRAESRRACRPSRSASVANALMLLRDTWRGRRTAATHPDRRIALSGGGSAEGKRYAARIKKPGAMAGLLKNSFIAGSGDGAVDPVRQGRLRRCANLHVGHFAALEDHQRRDRAHAELRGELRDSRRC
jgi:hypothetical protein